MFPQVKSTFVYNTSAAYKFEDLIFVFDSEYFHSVIIGLSVGRSYSSGCKLLRIETFMTNCGDLDCQFYFKFPFLPPLTLPTLNSIL